MVMAAAEHEGPGPDLYQLLGVARGASREEITRAWRRRAAAEHPDRGRRDAAAPARFRALAEAYQVLGDPARRAAYDRTLDRRAGAAPGPATDRRPRRPRRAGRRAPGRAGAAAAAGRPGPGGRGRAAAPADGGG